MLRSRAMLGQVEHEGRVVRGDDGMAVQRAEPLISADDWQAVQNALDGKRRPKYRAAPTAMLSGIAHCFDCGEVLHFHWMNKPNKQYRYYRCSGRTRKENGCKAQAPNAEWLDVTAEGLFLVEVGDLEVLEKRLIPGENHTAELAQVDQALKDLQEDRAAGLYSTDRGKAAYREMYVRLSDRYEAPAALPNRPDRWEMVPTGVTFREAWLERDSPEARRAFLLDVGVTVKASKSEVVLEVPEDLLKRVEERSAVERTPSR
jgi:site-specific DNA recombinase